MDLFERITNIQGLNLAEEIKMTIKKVKEKVPNLVEERMCKVYNGLLLNELLHSHIPVRLVNTLDLGINYEHFFLLIPIKTITGGGYILADLTFSQFHNLLLGELLTNGYQLINDIDFNKYLSIIAQKELDFWVLLEEAFYAMTKKEENIRK